MFSDKIPARQPQPIEQINNPKPTGIAQAGNKQNLHPCEIKWLSEEWKELPDSSDMPLEGEK
jgi:hypothetical protein